jgi:hypothetical protein
MSDQQLAIPWRRPRKTITSGDALVTVRNQECVTYERHVGTISVGCRDVVYFRPACAGGDLIATRAPVVFVTVSARAPR